MKATGRYLRSIQKRKLQSRKRQADRQYLMEYAFKSVAGKRDMIHIDEDSINKILDDGGLYPGRLIKSTVEHDFTTMKTVLRLS